MKKITSLLTIAALLAVATIQAQTVTSITNLVVTIVQEPVVTTISAQTGNQIVVTYVTNMVTTVSSNLVVNSTTTFPPIGTPAVPAQAQPPTNPLVITVSTSPVGATVTGGANAATIQNGFTSIIGALTGKATNWYGAAYMLYASQLANKVGAGVGVFYPVSDYLIGGVRLEYIDGGFYMPNGTITLQYPIYWLTNWMPSVVLRPFAYAGVGIPLSGATIVTTAGNVQIPGTLRYNNGQPTAITGIGCEIDLWKRSTPTTAWYQPASIGIIGDWERWSGFPGYQLRLGAEGHWKF